MNLNRVLPLLVLTAMVVACSAGAGGTGSDGTQTPVSKTPLTPEQLMAYAGPAPMKLKALEGVWMGTNLPDGMSVRIEVRQGTLTMAGKCLGQVAGTSTSAQLREGTLQTSDGGTYTSNASLTVLEAAEFTAGAAPSPCRFWIAAGTDSIGLWDPGVVRLAGVLIGTYGRRSGETKDIKMGFERFTKIGD